MKKSIEKFLEFNGKAIYFMAIDGQYWIAIKPICDALGVNYNEQFRQLKEHKLFGQLLRNSAMVAADNRVRKMLSLPERYVYGWIFTIQKSKSPDLLKYQKECCDVLYDHFHGMIAGRKDLLKTKVDLMRKENELTNRLLQTEEYRELLEVKNLKKSVGQRLSKNDAELIKSQEELWDN